MTGHGRGRGSRVAPQRPASPGRASPPQPAVLLTAEHRAPPPSPAGGPRLVSSPSPPHLRQGNVPPPPPPPPPQVAVGGGLAVGGGRASAASVASSTSVSSASSPSLSLPFGASSSPPKTPHVHTLAMARQRQYWEVLRTKAAQGSPLVGRAIVQQALEQQRRELRHLSMQQRGSSP